MFWHIRSKLTRKGLINLSGADLNFFKNHGHLEGLRGQQIDTTDLTN